MNFTIIESPVNLLTNLNNFFLFRLRFLILPELFETIKALFKILLNDYQKFYKSPQRTS